MSEAKRAPQITAALAASGGALIAGTLLGWTNPAQPPVQKGDFGYSVDNDQFSWVGSSMTLGAALFCVPIAFVINVLGRKMTLLLLNIPIVIGWALILCGPNLFCMYIGRFLMGIGAGGFCVAAPLYTGEIAQKEIRGMCGTFFQLMITIGILFVYCIGAFMPVKAMSTVCCMLVVVFIAIFVFMPESPTFLIKRNKDEEAAKSMRRLRGKDYDITAEIKEIKDTETKIKENPVHLGVALSQRATKKALFIGLGLMFFQQLCGINAVIFYSTDIFAASGSTLSPQLSTIIVGVVQVIATFVSTQVVDRTGRRLLLLMSGSVMALSTTAMGLYFFLKSSTSMSVDSLGWLPLGSLCLFIVMFSIGYGPVPWLMMGELFASEVRTVAASIATFLNWILAFVVTKTFVNIKGVLGDGQTFWLFSAISAIGVLFVICCVVETKGKSLNEIQQELAGGT